MTFIKVLNMRRVEFSRKCARILMVYAETEPELNQKRKDTQ